jgi:hypothetical protein
VSEWRLTGEEEECLLGILAEQLEGQEDTHTLGWLLSQLYLRVEGPDTGERA